jgi:ATP-binding cassette subfamily F protein uup
LELRRQSLNQGSTQGSKGTSSSAAEERQLKKDLARVERQISKARDEITRIKIEQEKILDPSQLQDLNAELLRLESELDVREEEWLTITTALEG